MRIVGEQNRSEIELDPVAAYRRGCKLDAMLRAAMPTVLPGVTQCCSLKLVRPEPVEG